jgi:hypothetical protein
METRLGRLATTAGSCLGAICKPLLLFVLAFLAAVAGAPVVFGSAFTTSDFVRQLASVGILDSLGGFLPRAPVAKTANYTDRLADQQRGGRCVRHAVHHARRRRRGDVHAARHHGDHGWPLV